MCAHSRFGVYLHLKRFRLHKPFDFEKKGRSLGTRSFQIVPVCGKRLGSFNGTFVADSLKGSVRWHVYKQGVGERGARR